MARRKTLNNDGERLDRWLVSYADFITLLFAFFVVMFAVSNINEGKLEEVTSSMIEAFNNTPRSLDPIQIGDINRSPKDKIVETNMSAQGGDGEQPVSSLKALASKMETAMMDLIGLEEITVRRTEQWLEIEINTSILFDSGSSSLVVTSQPILQKIAKILAPHPNPINVEGFTDNIPISTRAFPSNWELSAARAASVVHLFSKEGIEPSRMSAIGYGEFRPIASNDKQEGRRKNRRVVVAVLADDTVLPNQRHTTNKESIENAPMN